MIDYKNRGYTSPQQRAAKRNRLRLQLIAFAAACILGGTFALGVACSAIFGSCP